AVVVAPPAVPRGLPLRPPAAPHRDAVRVLLLPVLLAEGEVDPDQPCLRRGPAEASPGAACGDRRDHGAVRGDGLAGPAVVGVGIVGAVRRLPRSRRPRGVYEALQRGRIPLAAGAALPCVLIQEGVEAGEAARVAEGGVEDIEAVVDEA